MQLRGFISFSAAVALLLTVAFTGTAQQPDANKQEVLTDTRLVHGTWVSDKDHNWKITFYPGGKCLQYYQGKLTETDTYVFSNTNPPPCGVKVTAGEHQEFLSLKNVADSTQTCYYVNGLTKQALSLSHTTSGHLILFYRQTTRKK